MMRTLFILFAFVLAGCGFTPLHQSGADGTRLADVVVQLEKGQKVADNRAGFLLTQRLRDRIGNASSSSPYEIRITPSYKRQRLGLTDGDVASRYDVTVRASWVLVDKKTGKNLTRGNTSTVSTFGAPSGAYGVITADNVGVEQASKQTADKLVIELARYFATTSK